VRGGGSARRKKRVDRQKLIVMLVGLPARGKTFLCNKLMCYLNWWVGGGLWYHSERAGGCGSGPASTGSPQAGRGMDMVCQCCRPAASPPRLPLPKKQTLGWATPPSTSMWATTDGG
jgi:hypothetical protein